MVDKKELETIKSIINSLLEGAKRFSLPTLQPIYENYDLNEKERLVIEYLTKYPGHMQEQVVSGIDAKARITLIKTIKRLWKEGYIIKTENKSKKKTYNLYVNYQNTIASSKQDLTLFRHYYSELIDHARYEKKIRYLLNDKNKCLALIGPYKYLYMMYIASDLLLWDRRPLDPEALHRKFDIFFKTMNIIHIELRKVLDDSGSKGIATQLLFDSSYGFSELDILHILKTFEEYGLSEDAEQVIDVLWKISYPILHLIYPLHYEKHFRDGTLRDWRKLLENKYKPKTNMLEGLFSQPEET